MEKESIFFPYRKYYILLACFVMLITAFFSIYFSNQPLLEYFGFRQTQTAITSFWMIQEGWRFDYQTPIAGFPWSLPFEFPIYQTIVALIAYLGNFPLDSVGRIVSTIFLLACFWPSYQICKRLNLLPEVVWVFVTLLWSSPIYLFVSRTFMIETTALFFIFSALPYFIDMLSKNSKKKAVLLFMFWTTLGMMQKVTTALPILIITGIIYIIYNIRIRSINSLSFREIGVIFVAFTIPFIISGVWTYYIDSIKSQNLLGTQLTSKALTNWNFGTLSQRVDKNVLKTIFWDRICVRNISGLVGIAGIIIALFAIELRIKQILIISLTLFFFPIFLFINLHFIHDYYQSSSVLFITGALSICIVYLSKRLIKNSVKYPVILFVTIFFLISNLYMFKKNYWEFLQSPINTTQNQILAISDLVRRYTPKDSGIVVFGFDWSSEVAYYSERKSFTVPNWLKEYDHVWEKPDAYIGNLRLGAIVFGPNINSKFGLKDIINNNFFKKQQQLFKIAGCFIWLPGIDKIVVTEDNKTLMPFDFLSKEIDLKQRISSPITQIQFLGSIDIVNGTVLPTKTVIVDSILSVNGWTAVDTVLGMIPDEVYLTLTDSDGNVLYIETKRVPRKDVQDFFHQPKVLNAGYEAVYDVKNLNGNFILSLARVNNGKLEHCSNLKVSIKIQ